MNFLDVNFLDTSLAARHKCLCDEAERRLTNDLMNNYLTNVRPVKSHVDTVEVTLDMALNMIIDLVSFSNHGMIYCPLG